MPRRYAFDKEDIRTLETAILFIENEGQQWEELYDLLERVQPKEKNSSNCCSTCEMVFKE